MTPRFVRGGASVIRVTLDLELHRWSVERKNMRRLALWAIRIAGLIGFIAAAAGGLRVFNYGREFAGLFSLAVGMILLCGAFSLGRLIEPRD